MGTARHLGADGGQRPFPGDSICTRLGPNDRDETIGPNKPFHDLAWSLALQGIAVLRYDKRTKVLVTNFTPEITKKLTVQDETVDDALLAVQFLRETKDINPERIFVAGHSLGAYLAPRIGQQDPDPTGWASPPDGRLGLGLGQLPQQSGREVDRQKEDRPGYPPNPGGAGKRCKSVGPDDIHRLTAGYSADQLN